MSLDQRVRRVGRVERGGDQLDVGVDLVQRLGIEDEDREAELVELLDDRRWGQLVAGGEDEVRLGVDDELHVDLRSG